MNLNWLKLDVNILDDQKIKLIRKYPDGNGIMVLWVGLLCLSMKSDIPGFIYVANGIPYSTEDLSNILDIEKKTVELGLHLFSQYKMINIIEGGVIEVINFNKYQNLDKIENKREKDKIRQQRFRQKAIEECVTHESRVTNADVTPQIREDKIRTDQKREEKSKNFPAEIISLTQKLYDSIDKPTRWDNKPPDLNKWADDIDKLNRIDGISYELIDSVIEFIKQYDRWKWREVIQSGHGFRKHFDTIEKQLKKNHTQTANDMQSDVDYYENKIKEMQR